MRMSANIQRGIGRLEAHQFTPLSVPDTDSRPAPNPIDILCAKFPVVRRLAGDESFRAMARRFIAGEPPHRTGLLLHGETFPDFLRRQDTTASIEYIADIARLEMVQGIARHAENVPPIRADLSSLQHESLTGLRVLLHPSVFLVASRFPVVTIWRNNRSYRKNTMIERWRAESALVARPFRLAPASRRSYIYQCSRRGAYGGNGG